MSDFCDHNTSTRLLGKQLVMVALLVLHFSYMRQLLLLVSLFYGKCYVTMFIREYVAFSYRYWGKFLLKKNEKKLSRIIFFHRKRRFLFFFYLRFFESIVFFERFFPLHFIFFLCVNDLTDFIGFAIYFFFIVMKRHNRFFLNW